MAASCTFKKCQKEASDIQSETGCAHNHSSLYIRHSQTYVESVSVEICTIMTRLGYGEEIRRWRVENYREHERLVNALQSGVTRTTAGSKGKGLTYYFESDFDLLYTFKYVLCVEAGIDLHIIPEHIEVFMMDTRVYPGHCRLLQEREGHACYPLIYNALCDNGHGNVILCSSLLLDGHSTMEHEDLPLEFHERAGPSIPQSLRGRGGGRLNYDNVIAIRCFCPSILERWAARPRNWPSPFIVQKVVSLHAYVTPVGFKGSECKNMEWRICFNTGEAELVHNLNDTQAKVYVMLKMILKDVLKPLNKEITSYVLKNIILWQAEKTQQTEFHARSLLFWLHDGLKELRTAIEKKQLSYYMIPERNLMAACGLEDALQSKWVADITDMLDEGPRVILRLEKIRKAIVASPEPMMWFSKRKMEMEMLFMEGLNRGRRLCRDENGDGDDSGIIRTIIQLRIVEGL